MTTITKLSKLIEKQKFDWVNPDIKDSLFSLPKTIGTDFKLYHFNKRISSEDAIEEMEKEGYRPANAWELVSWKEGNKDAVIALGSVSGVGDSRRVPYLYGGGSERSLGLGWFDGGWNADYRFLAVRNVPQELGNLDIGTLNLP